jgi:hypothetical protein
MLDLDGGQQKWLFWQVHISILKVELQRLPEVGEGLFHGSSLAGHVQLGTPGDEPLSFPVNGCRQLELHRVRMVRTVFIGNEEGEDRWPFMRLAS